MFVCTTVMKDVIKNFNGIDKKDYMNFVAKFNEVCSNFLNSSVCESINEKLINSFIDFLDGKDESQVCQALINQPEEENVRPTVQKVRKVQLLEDDKKEGDMCSECKELIYTISNQIKGGVQKDKVCTKFPPQEGLRSICEQLIGEAFNMIPINAISDSVANYICTSINCCL